MHAGLEPAEPGQSSRKRLGRRRCMWPPACPDVVRSPASCSIGWPGCVDVAAGGSSWHCARVLGLSCPASLPSADAGIRGDVGVRASSCSCSSAAGRFALAGGGVWPSCAACDAEKLASSPSGSSLLAEPFTDAAAAGAATEVCSAVCCWLRPATSGWVAAAALGFSSADAQLSAFPLGSRDGCVPLTCWSGAIKLLLAWRLRLSAKCTVCTRALSARSATAPPTVAAGMLAAAQPVCITCLAAAALALPLAQASPAVASAAGSVDAHAWSSKAPPRGMPVDGGVRAHADASTQAALSACPEPLGCLLNCRHAPLLEQQM